MNSKDISKVVLQRLPTYLAYLKGIPAEGPEHISATAIASALNMGEVQVRKDLALVSDGGRPKVGYLRQSLIEDLEQFLGCNNTNTAILVGAGKLGCALLGYSGFEQYGLKIIAAFDVDQEKDGLFECGTPIYSVSKLPHFCREHAACIGIITVPADCAQNVCDMLLENGMKAIWSFAPTHLDVPEGVLVQYENMAASMAVLSVHLKAQMQGM